MSDTSFEDNFDAKFASLNKKLTSIESRIQNIVNGFLANPEKSRAYWANIQAQLNLEFSNLSFEFAEWAETAIPKQYSEYIISLAARIKTIKGFTATAEMLSKELLTSNASRNIVQALYKDAIDAFNGAVAAGQANVNKLLRITQQSLISESLVNVTIAEGFVGGNLDTAISALFGQLQSKLLGMAKNMQFVQAGSMRFTPSYYAEMVARTKFHDAHTFATLAQAQNYGTDLVQVSSHNTRTAICIPHEGKVYSISGKDKDFPPLDGTPPFHPNCLHLIYPTFAGAMKIQGTYDGFKAFSNGDADTPPTPSAFVPIDKRGVA